MKRWSFYHRDSGVFALRTFATTSIDEFKLEHNTPADHIAIEGTFHPLSHRFDLSNGTVVRADAPDEHHEWDGSRWVPNSALRARSIAAAKHEGRYLEVAEEERMLVRALILNPADEKARERLMAIHLELAQLKTAATAPILRASQP